MLSREFSCCFAFSLRAVRVITLNYSSSNYMTCTGRQEVRKSSGSYSSSCNVFNSCSTPASTALYLLAFKANDEFISSAFELFNLLLQGSLCSGYKTVFGELLLD